MSDHEDWIAAARRRCEASMPGDWVVHRFDRSSGEIAYQVQALDYRPGADDEIDDVLATINDHRNPKARATAEFIAAARTDLPRALDLVVAADAIIKAMAEAERPYREPPTKEVRALIATYEKLRRGEP